MSVGPRGPTEEPLDLAAVEARLESYGDDVPSEIALPNFERDVRALLAHARALRAALQFVFTARGDVTGELFPEAWEHAAVVLAQAVDPTSSE